VAISIRGAATAVNPGMVRIPGATLA